MDAMYKVYKHENLINGKVYIGITSMSVQKRWENGNGYARQPLFWRAIQKYGWDAFSHEVLIDGLSKGEAEEKEIEFISFYKSDDPRNGYNIQHGGATYGKHSIDTRRKMSVAHRGKVITLEQRHKISETLKGRTMPLETRLKISASNSGEKAYWYGKVGPAKGRKAPPDELQRRSESQKGKTLSDDTKRKISESLKGEKSPWLGRKHTTESLEKMRQNATNKRPVRCVESGVVYDSISEAGRETGINYRNIHAVCAGKRSVASGFHWEYVR